MREQREYEEKREKERGDAAAAVRQSEKKSSIHSCLSVSLRQRKTNLPD